MNTGVPTFTWLKSHSAEGIAIRIQPCEAEYPSDDGSGVPWMPTAATLRPIQRVPSGLPGPRRHGIETFGPVGIRRIPPRVALHHGDLEVAERRRVGRLPGGDGERPRELRLALDLEVLELLGVATDDDCGREERAHAARAHQLGHGGHRAAPVRSQCLHDGRHRRLAADDVAVPLGHEARPEILEHQARVADGAVAVLGHASDPCSHRVAVDGDGDRDLGARLGPSRLGDGQLDVRLHAEPRRRDRHAFAVDGDDERRPYGHPHRGTCGGGRETAHLNAANRNAAGETRRELRLRLGLRPWLRGRRRAWRGGRGRRSRRRRRVGRRARRVGRHRVRLLPGQHRRGEKAADAEAQQKDDYADPTHARSVARKGNGRSP